MKKILLLSSLLALGIVARSVAAPYSSTTHSSSSSSSYTPHVSSSSSSGSASHSSDSSSRSTGSSYTPHSSSSSSGSGSSHNSGSGDSTSHSSSYTPRPSESTAHSSSSSSYTPHPSSSGSSSSGSGNYTSSRDSSSYSSGTSSARTTDSSTHSGSSIAPRANESTHSSGNYSSGTTDTKSRPSSYSSKSPASSGSSGNYSSIPSASSTKSSSSPSLRPSSSSLSSGTPARTSSSGSLETKRASGGVAEAATRSGQVREKVASKPAGETTQHLTATGRVQHESVKKADGTQQTTHYAANGNVQKTVTLKNDGTKVTTHVQYGRNGKERATETVKVDVRGREIGKTVVVKQTTIIARKTILRDVTVVKNYDRSPFGFAYHPVYGASLPVLASWYDPYWYSSSGVYVSHPFHYSWGWQASDWYQYQPHYFAAYDVYPTPSYWLTDWMIAGYVADRFAASASAAHSREEARLAREDAARAGALAAQATEQAEIAEARGAQREAEARAALAEARAAKAESQELAGGSLSANSNATPIDNDTKEALRAQIEQTVADNKRIAEETAKGQTPVVPDLSEALADPKHIYPVSQSINVIAAADQNAAGTLTEGDLLKLEPGQASLLNHAGENTFVTMRVMTSKGEDGEVKAGTLISISLKALQDFDSEFRAKLDVGLAEADKNQDQFRSAAL